MSNRVLRDTDATVTQTFLVNGTATDVGTVTLDVTRENGTAVQTGAATTNNADGTYDYTLTDTELNRLDRLKLEWTATGTSQTLVSYVEVVGNHLVAEPDIRAFDPALSNTTKYPDADLLAARDWVTDRLEQWTGRSWVPRFRLAKWRGGGTMLWVSDSQQARGGSSGEGSRSDIHELIAADENGTAVTVSDVTVLDGGFAKETGVWQVATRTTPLPVTAEWAYGLQFPEDGVQRIALLLIRDYLTRGPVSEYAISSANDYGTTRYITEGGPMRNPARIPEVNAWVASHSAKTPLVI